MGVEELSRVGRWSTSFLSLCLVVAACGGGTSGKAAGAGGAAGAPGGTGGRAGVPSATGGTGPSDGGSIGTTGGSTGSAGAAGTGGNSAAGGAPGGSSRSDAGPGRDAAAAGGAVGGNRDAQADVRSTGGATGTGGTGSAGDGGVAPVVDGGAPSGPLSDETRLSFTDSHGVTSRYHRYAAGLDWSKRVGLLIYTDGSGEYGLKNPNSSYLLTGTNGLVQVAKRNNMVLLTPLAPGEGCPDGDGTCWYMDSSGISPSHKARWSAELVKYVQKQYGTDPARVAFGGYSSGAQWTTEYFGPLYASEIMTDGVAVAISYGGSPKVTPNFTAAFKANVPFVWDVGDKDSSYTGSGAYGVKAGYDWYTANGFTTEITVVPGLGHDRSGQFGGIMDREIKQHVR
jgi:hypothetical protein